MCVGAGGRFCRRIDFFATSQAAARFAAEHSALTGTVQTQEQALAAAGFGDILG
ncbi:organomercurial lyase [Streptomyces sp. H10-C2]|uniref:organomercurial lyase n=1 Tax=unclassified Streptomyces TaxID=2593676 RepID=UPI0024B8D6C9|nr:MULTISPECIES: organomercurial lyase [unclassified Streptomyces]MDJ0345391.1 organomercurial lyase [Streptomyces sp. PH10-H1]MDJ0372145.1 organomercurial lyase [Streptomyces sp. H10-C2]